jgi:hypothetical protein
MSLLDSRQSSLLHHDCASCARTAQPRRPKAHREDGCAAGGHIQTCASEQRNDHATRQVNAYASELQHRTTTSWGSLACEVGAQALTNNYVSVEQGCLTPAFSGAANGIGSMMRTVLRGLRCNALLDTFLESEILLQ